VVVLLEALEHFPLPACGWLASQRARRHGPSAHCFATSSCTSLYTRTSSFLKSCRRFCAARGTTGSRWRPGCALGARGTDLVYQLIDDDRRALHLGGAEVLLHNRRVETLLAARRCVRRRPQASGAGQLVRTPSDAPRIARGSGPQSQPAHRRPPAWRPSPLVAPASVAAHRRASAPRGKRQSEGTFFAGGCAMTPLLFKLPGRWRTSGRGRLSSPPACSSRTRKGRGTSSPSTAASPLPRGSRRSRELRPPFPATASRLGSVRWRRAAQAPCPAHPGHTTCTALWISRLEAQCRARARARASRAHVFCALTAADSGREAAPQHSGAAGAGRACRPQDRGEHDAGPPRGGTFRGPLRGASGGAGARRRSQPPFGNSAASPLRR
jgi:hypothetical protein